MESAQPPDPDRVAPHLRLVVSFRSKNYGETVVTKERICITGQMIWFADAQQLITFWRSVQLAPLISSGM